MSPPPVFCVLFPAWPFNIPSLSEVKVMLSLSSIHSFMMHGKTSDSGQEPANHPLIPTPTPNVQSGEVASCNMDHYVIWHKKQPQVSPIHKSDMNSCLTTLLSLTNSRFHACRQALNVPMGGHATWASIRLETNLRSCETFGCEGSKIEILAGSHGYLGCQAQFSFCSLGFSVFIRGGICPS